MILGNEKNCKNTPLLGILCVSVNVHENQNIPEFLDNMDDI